MMIKYCLKPTYCRIGFKIVLGWEAKEKPLGGDKTDA